MINWGEKIIFFDGGLGSQLIKKGMKPGESPEAWNIERAEVLCDIHKSYFEAGADIVMANTFGANRIKLEGLKYSVEEVISSAIKNAKSAGNGLVALDIGPTGKLLSPLGDLDFEDAVSAFAEMVKIGAKAGADVVCIETMSDMYELKAAVLAAKENCDLPVFATVVFDEKGKLLTGGDVASVVAMLEGLGVDALGVNCGLGPVQMKEIVREMLAVASIPVIVNPNAGLPREENGETVYDIDADTFAKTMREIAEMGAYGIGGCCGTTPEHIAKTVALCKDIKPKPIEKKNRCVVSSYSKAVVIDEKPVIVGERINPTGKKRFKEALKNDDIDYILNEGITQMQNGAHILDVNVGLPEIDEEKCLVRVMSKLQEIIDLPLQLDTSNVKALEAALRRYNGKAMINSVNGKEESLSAVLPLVKKYGGVVVGLTLDESGIPTTAEGRFEIAKKIVDRAEAMGIARENIIIDVLCMTISTDVNGAKTTLEALKLVRERLNVKTILGVSNISFGLPKREVINANFYTLALQNGLSAGIINPNSEAMMNSYRAFCALYAYDENCADYIAHFSGEEVKTVQKEEEMSLSAAIERGMGNRAYSAAEKLLLTTPPLEVINSHLVPALDRVGCGFEEGKVFLPQLLMSAEAASLAFDAVKESILKSGAIPEKKGEIIVATVKGDIHDIGKNIVKVLLENYGYDVIDLGKDVPAEEILLKAKEKDIKFVGLSALMTTTVPAMAETVKLFASEMPECKIMVGGAVLSQDYADAIGAHFYAKDAMGAVHCAEEVFSS